MRRLEKMELMSGEPPVYAGQLRRVIRDSSLATAVALGIGCVTTFLLVRDAGAAAFAQIDWRGGAFCVLAALFAAAINFVTRFIRWQFLLRTSGVLLPTRESARLFFSSFAVLLTPLCLGEILFKSLFLLRRRGTPMGLTASVAIVERLHDAIALMFIAGVAGLWSGHAAGWLLGGVLLLCLSAVRVSVVRLAAGFIALVGQLVFGRRIEVERVVFEGLERRAVFLPMVVLSIASWLPVALIPTLAATAVNTSLDPVAAARLFSSAALLGGISLVPGGIVIAGHAMLNDLMEIGMALFLATAIVAMTRVVTLGFAILVGLGVLAWTAWCGEFSDTGAQAHFDRVSEVYDAEIPLHIRDYLVRKKVDLIADQLETGALRGLDVGCGRGYYLEEFRRRSYVTFGVDLSAAQLGSEHTNGMAVASDALHLPFADRTFDFAYSVNLFHHLPSRQLQEEAFAEVGRVLKPGAAFFLHEINVRNPLFRFYMSYVFPLIRTIDNGTEQWLKPNALEAPPGMVLRAVRYFTFIPDFLPQWALKRSRGLERRLEESRWASMSAHFLAKFERIV